MANATIDAAAHDADETRRDVEVAQRVLSTEISALETLRDSVDASFSEAVSLICEAASYVIVTGVGKSGHIGSKIAATFASTGTPSFFVHPTEASHGDLGMLKDGSVVLALSNSGETRELRDILVYCRREHLPLIAITARQESFLGAAANVCLVLPSTEEACPNRLAPTSSTTMALALGDALAVAAMQRRGFTSEDFGSRHPGGALGMRLQLVGEWLTLRKTPPNPIVDAGEAFVDVIRAISAGRCGAVSVIDANGALTGMITDGDIRRAVESASDPRGLTAADMQSADPITVSVGDRMGVVVEVMQSKRISQVVVAENGAPVAVIHIKDLMQDGYL